MSATTKLVGVGNRYRGDDGVGLVVLQQLGERLPHSMLVVSDGELTGLLELFEQNSEVVIIDALEAQDGKLKAGSILHLNPAVDGLEDTGLRASTHAMGLAEAIEMARALDSLPQQLRIIGIVGEEFSNRQGLTPAVQLAADQVVRELLEEYSHA